MKGGLWERENQVSSERLLILSLAFSAVWARAAGYVCMDARNFSPRPEACLCMLWARADCSTPCEGRPLVWNSDKHLSTPCFSFHFLEGIHKDVSHLLQPWFPLKRRVQNGLRKSVRGIPPRSHLRVKIAGFGYLAHFLYWCSDAQSRLALEEG